MKKLLLLAITWTLPSAIALCQPAKLAPPLHTDGPRIIDATGRPVRLASANWYGFDQKEYVVGGLNHVPLATMIEQIRKIGLNAIRLPWANETFERNPIVPDYAVAANPQFKGRHAMEIMDEVIRALASARIMVILDNHVSRADWCCSETDGNGLWYNEDYPESRWLADWSAMAMRYREQPWVVGADLRNEPRAGSTWGGTNPAVDWRAAAERGAKAVLAANPNLLILVESPDWSRDFRDVVAHPIRLPIEHRLVYSPHAYDDSYGIHNERFESRAGFLVRIAPGVPVFIGETGTCQTLDCDANSEWFRTFMQLLRVNENVSWSYWPLNGTQSSGHSRRYDATEGYGLLTTDYKAIGAPKITEILREVEPQPVR